MGRFPNLEAAVPVYVASPDGDILSARSGGGGMLKDLRHGARMLLHARGWTAVVVLSLAVGIGANTALFSAINGMLIETLPVSHPEQLVRLRYAGPNDMVTSSSDYGFSAKDAGGLDMRTTFSYPMYQQFVADNQTMTDLFAFAPFGSVNIVVDGAADIGRAFLSSGTYYRALGVRAALGRTIGPDDDKADAPPVALLSHKYWHSRFAGDPAALGKIVRVNNVPVTIVGVIEPGFTGVQRVVDEPPDISLPLALDSQLQAGEPRLNQATYWWLQVMGRLKPNATAAQVHGNLDGPFRATARAGLDTYLAGLTDQARSTAANRRRTNVPSLRVDSASRGVYDVPTSDVRSISILTVVALLVLLIVCANVANMLLSRATARRKELSVRLSLGATRWRLIRQLLTESLLLAGIGGALGVLVGHWGKLLLPGDAGRVTALDWRVLAFVLTVTVATGILFGIAPALRATSMNVSSTLKENSRSVVGARSRLGKGLLIAQVAISLVLLVGAGLFLRTLQNLRHVDIGFNPEKLVLFRVNPSLNRYDQPRTIALYTQLIERLEAVPGVRAAALSAPALLSGSVNSTSIFVQGRTYALDQRDSINRLVVSPGFFSTMGIPIARGRAFTPQDTDTATKVVLINQTAAQKYFPGSDPIGQHFGSSPETTSQLEIVGIVRDTKYNSVREAVPPTMYVPYPQARPGSAVFEVRTTGEPAQAMTALREAVRQLDPNLPLMDVSTQIEQVEKRFQQEKIFAQAYALFGALALLLAAVGLFGVMSYNVSRRTNEIGIRMALGAQRSHVLRLVLGESMTLVAIGVVIGILTALAASRFVATLLFDLGATDLLTMTVAVIVMVTVAAAAGYLPARRASLVDPMVALHEE